MEVEKERYLEFRRLYTTKEDHDGKDGLGLGELGELNACTKDGRKIGVKMVGDNLVPWVYGFTAEGGHSTDTEGRGLGFRV